MAEQGELVVALGGEDGGGAATEAAVVDTGDGGVVVGEFGPELSSGDERVFGLFVGVRVGAVVGGVAPAPAVVVIVRGGHGEI